MDRFNIIEEPFEGLKILKLKPINDDRGFFQRLFCSEDFKELGLEKNIVNINHSLTKKKGMIRGLHFQHFPAKEIKIIKCIKGEILDVVVDIRKNSPTFLKSYSVELKEDNDLMIYVPEGFAHGFQSLKDNSEIIYFVTSSYSMKLESGLNPFDPRLGITWPLKCSYISEKDKKHPFLETDFIGI